MNILKQVGAYAFLALLLVVAYIGLWAALAAFGVPGFPPLLQPHTALYAYELPGKWLIIPAAVVAVAMWLLCRRLFGGPGTFVREGPKDGESSRNR